MWLTVRENIDSENLEQVADIRKELQCRLEAALPSNIGSNFFLNKIGEGSLAEDNNAGKLIPKLFKDKLFAALQ